MTDTRVATTGRRRPVSALAGALIVLGLLALALARIERGSAQLPYGPDVVPPSTVQVTAGDTYQLAVPGGVPALLGRGATTVESGGTTVVALSCSYTTPTTAARRLAVTAEAADTKAENTVGSFVAPSSGAIHVDCDHWGAVFVPDADDRPFDIGGLALLVGAIVLTLGAGLALSAGYAAWRRRSSTAEDVPT